MKAMDNLEGSMHVHADNPEPEQVVVTTCCECDEPIFVGERVGQNIDGMMHEDCWIEICNTARDAEVFTVDETHILE